MAARNRQAANVPVPCAAVMAGCKDAAGLGTAAALRLIPGTGGFRTPALYTMLTMSPSTGEAFSYPPPAVWQMLAPVT